VSPQLLYAIARVESGLNPRAVNLTHRQRTGSYDIGLMQINSSNLPALARHGIAEHDLYDPCTNIHVGAWLLAQAFNRHGINWDGVGAYNAACTQLKGPTCQAARNRYAWQVYRRLPGAQVAPVQNAKPAESARPLILSARVSP
jgi:soluble lytic murein transglycosylase-like protein